MMKRGIRDFFVSNTSEAALDTTASAADSQATVSDCLFSESDNEAEEAATSDPQEGSMTGDCQLLDLPNAEAEFDWF